MKTKIIAGIISIALVSAGTLAYAASTTGTGNVLKDTFQRMHFTGSGGCVGGNREKGTEWRWMKGFGGFDARETVMDKLINGETLTDAEKVTLATIRTERATMKAQQVAREAQMAEIKPILEKVKAGTALTTDEQTKLDAFKKIMPQMQDNKEGKDGKRGGGRGMMGW